MPVLTSDAQARDLLRFLLGGRSAEVVIADTHAAIVRDAQDPRPLITEVLRTPQGMTFGRVRPVRVAHVPVAPVIVQDLNAHLADPQPVR